MALIRLSGQKWFSPGKSTAGVTELHMWTVRVDLGGVLGLHRGAAPRLVTASRPLFFGPLRGENVKTPTQVLYAVFWCWSVCLLFKGYHIGQAPLPLQVKK